MRVVPRAYGRMQKIWDFASTQQTAAAVCQSEIHYTLLFISIIYMYYIGIYYTLSLQCSFEFCST
jgi:hypothetical protein